MNILPKLCISLLLASQFSFAEDAYQPTIPKDTVVAFEKARDERRTGDLQQSVIQLQNVIAMQPDYYLANYNLALALTYLKKFPEAESAYLKSLEIAKNNNIKDYSLYNSIGWMYLISGDFTKAEKNFDIALSNIENIPTDIGKRKIYNNAGLNYIYLGKYDDAERMLKIAIEQYKSPTAKENLDMLENVRARNNKKDNP